MHLLLNLKTIKLHASNHLTGKTARTDRAGLTNAVIIPPSARNRKIRGSMAFCITDINKIMAEMKVKIA
jgi:hypothetical protein